MLEYIFRCQLLVKDYSHDATVYIANDGHAITYIHGSYSSINTLDQEPVLGIRCSDEAVAFITCYNNIYWCRGTGNIFKIASLKDDTVVRTYTNNIDIFLITESGKVYMIDGEGNSQRKASSLKVKKVIAKCNRILYITSTGEVYGEGSNNHWLMGEKNREYSPLTKLPIPAFITSIDTGHHFSVAVTDKGKVWGCYDGWFEAMDKDNIVDLSITNNITTLTNAKGKKMQYWKVPI